MIHLESTGGSWYGEIKQMKDYTLYAFFPKTAIYARRTKVVIGTMGEMCIRDRNTQTAESRIRDTDMAEEMVEYSKNCLLYTSSNPVTPIGAAAEFFKWENLLQYFFDFHLKYCKISVKRVIF